MMKRDDDEGFTVRGVLSCFVVVVGLLFALSKSL